MPTYEYRCPAGHEFEKFQRMSDEPGAECPDCGLNAERLLSAGAGLLFKGDGFYITDYRSDSYKKAAEKDKKSDTSGSGSGSKAADAGSKSADSGSKSADSGSSGSSGPKKKGSAE